MSGFVYNEEAAGSSAGIFGVIASIIIPFAAPAIMGTLLGSAAVSALGAAGMAHAQGARGGDVWQAALTGGATGLVGGLARGTPLMGGSGTAAGAGLNVQGVPGPVDISTAAAIPVGAPAASPGVVQGITSIFGNNPETMRRVLTFVTTAAVNGMNAGRLNSLVSEQRRALAAMTARDREVYLERLGVGREIIQNARRMDPNQAGIQAAADVANIGRSEFEQSMRNIAVGQGGALKSGQKKAYERGASLEIARGKALASNQAFKQAQLAQSQMMATGGQFLVPDEQGMRQWQLDTELRSAGADAANAANASTWGAALAGLTDRTPRQAPSPVPNQEDNDAFFGGASSPFRGLY